MSRSILLPMLLLSSLLFSACATAPVPLMLDTSANALPPQAMVSAADRRAAAAGVAMLVAGGSAFDASAATLLALSVVEPQSSGIGGGGLLVYQAAGAAAPVSFDGRETAPASASQSLFLDGYGKPLPTGKARPGGKSVGVPGNIAMIALAHAQFGKLPWATLFQPAIVLARSGYEMSPHMANAIERQAKSLALTREGAALYLQTDGRPRPVGSLIVNEPLARTLEAIAAKGPSAFYTGPNADALIATVTSASMNPSGMTRADLAAYRAKLRPPVCAPYRLYRICGMGPPSSGGLAVIAILKQLEDFDLAALGPDNPVTWHLLAESQRLAFADRATYVGDNDFVSVPVAGLLDPVYLRARGRLISPEKTMVTVVAGTPPGAPARIMSNGSEVASTSHFSAVDTAGNVASLTSTVEGAFGSGLVSGGYVLNNELTDFDFAPVVDGTLVANRVQPGKRPRSSMSPTIVYDNRGAVVLSIGAAGGPTIPAQVAKSIIAVLDWKLPVQAAISLPVMMVFGDRLIIESGAQGEPLAKMIPALIALGHQEISVVALPYKANGIERVGVGANAGWRGGADPRSEGAALAVE
ncbi:MAG: gamma-glutamyltransferase [Propionivibrio sp.]|uniref:gamma-glutamyltransferase n=1 Tax=Propionivibrio sp. TaxID=2212460 RepID=UPI001A6124D6|nr:gamma-glutamyltransferase [Propionivibrio sp.]MBL8414847.1 gamma-glutamyltransferase [Propionivibrio sp.]